MFLSPAANKMPPMIGQKLGRYQIVKAIGSGGMGEVYRAHDEQLDRDIAIKVLPASRFSDPTARSRLLREARSAAGLNHPYICTVHEVGEAEGQAYIAMELVEGQPLSARLAAGALPAEVVTRYGLQLAEAVAHAHARGIIHRDLKSSNVIITTDGRVKVLDFGLAKRLRDEQLEEATRSQLSFTTAGSVVGTLAYMSPEQLRGEPADARSDIWALGVILYEMAAGKLPFRGQTGFELSSAILNQPPQPLPAKVPAQLRALISRCLSKQPEERYQRAAEVAAVLEAIQSHKSSPWIAWRYTWRRRWVIAAVIAAVLTAALFALDAGGLRSRLTGSRAAPQIDSLAVLPLANLSGDPAQDYFSDGITDALITDLTRSGGPRRVIARGSVVRYKNTQKTLTEIAEELRVQRLVTGAVQRSGNRVSISAQLIDPESGEQLWAERYERELRDVLALQNEIVSAIIRQIKGQLTPQQRAQLASARVVNPAAYEAVLKANFHIQKLAPAHLDLALRYCEQALKLDPGYAPAHVCLSSVWGAQAHMGLVSPLHVGRQAQDSAERAVELDPTLPEAHSRVGALAFLFAWDWPKAEEAFQKAGDVEWGRIVYADFLLLSGRPQEALATMQRALDRDPLNSWLQVSVGGRMLRLRRYDEGISLLQKVLESEPNMPLAHRYLWTAFHTQKNQPAAFQHAKTFLTLFGQPEASAALERGYAKAGYTHAMKLAADLLAQRSKQTYIQPSEIARLYAYAGDKDRAFAWLEKAYEGRDSWMSFINSDPRLDSLHSDPRFDTLLQRMKIPR